MLEFFRKHQRYFFVVITVVIVISFSFFGTYDTLSNNSFREQIAFTTVDGKDVTRHELDEMVYFLGTDAHDKLIFGGAWGPNFLNNGVIRKDFLETGLGAQLATSYAAEVRQDLLTRLDKEKRFVLYTHPDAKFIGVETAWNLFSPDMKSYYQMLRLASDPTSQEALQARIALFLMERQFPSSLMRQVLRYQEKQYNWLTPDPNLDYADLSLFGYHTVEDWFGPRFVRLAAEFIMNAAVIAEQRGYQVSKADALADLMRNSEISYQQNVRNPNIGVTSSHEYFNEQLRRLGMDQNTAARVWGQVLLFRRLFQDLGSSVFVDPFTFKHIDAYALESVQGELYRLPKELHLNSFKALQKFEIYLDGVSKRSEDDKVKLTLPTTFLSVAEVTKKTPELVESRYVLEISQVDKKALQSTISVKETWNWEVSDKGWELLKKQFADVGTAKVASRDDRFNVLDKFDDKTRSRVDQYARESIVNEHPEWLVSALEEAPTKQQIVNLHEKGGHPLFAGLQNGSELIPLLNAAPLASDDKGSVKPAAKEAADKLAQFTADKTTYYRIQVIDRAVQPEILTFAEADKQGVLDKLLDATLEAYYLKNRENDPKSYQKEDKSWKAFADVKSQVADKYFDNVVKAISASYAAANPSEKTPNEMIGDFAATLRFYPYVAGVEAKLKKDPALADQLTREPVEPSKEKEGLTPKAPLAEQWKLERSHYQITRSSPENVLDKTKVFGDAEGTWTAVNTPANGDVNFFHLEHKGNDMNTQFVSSSVMQARELLSDDVQQRLMSSLLATIQAKHAISLKYLDTKQE